MFAIDWQKGSNSFVKSTVLVPAVSYTIPAGNMLEVNLTVENQSESAMWVAYDTTLQPSAINFPLETAVPHFETKSSALTIPTLSQWGLSVLAVLFAAAAAWRMTRQVRHEAPMEYI